MDKVFKHIFFQNSPTVYSLTETTTNPVTQLYLLSSHAYPLTTYTPSNQSSHTLSQTNISLKSTFFPFQGQQGYQSSPKSKLSPRYGDNHSLPGSHNRSLDHRTSGIESSQSHIRPTIDTMMMQQQQQRNALNGNGNGNNSNNSNLNSPGNTVQSSLSPDTHYSQPRGRGRSVSRGRDGRLYSRDSSTGGHGGAFSETGTTTSNTTRHRSYSAPRSRYLRSSSKENFGYNKGLTPRNVAYDERWRARSNSPPHRHFSPSLLAKSANERILSTSRENETFETRLNRSISNYYIRQVLNPNTTLTSKPQLLYKPFAKS